MPEDTSPEAASAASRTLRDKNASANAKKAGLSEPFTDKKDLDRDGVDAETGLFEGIDPEGSERVSVTLEGLKAEFGDKEGERRYLAIAGIAGGSVFFNPATEATSFRPPLGISKLNKKHMEAVEKILAEEGN